MDEAMKIAALQLRTLARAGDADSDTLRELARAADSARGELQSSARELRHAKDGINRLTSMLNQEAEARQREKERAEKAEAVSECRWQLLVSNGNECVALRKKVRELRKQLRAAKGGG